MLRCLYVPSPEVALSLFDTMNEQNETDQGHQSKLMAKSPKNGLFAQCAEIIEAATYAGSSLEQTVHEQGYPFSLTSVYPNSWASGPRGAPAHLPGSRFHLRPWLGQTILHPGILPDEEHCPREFLQ